MQSEKNDENLMCLEISSSENLYYSETKTSQLTGTSIS